MSILVHNALTDMSVAILRLSITYYHFPHESSKTVLVSCPTSALLFVLKILDLGILSVPSMQAKRGSLYINNFFKNQMREKTQKITFSSFIFPYNMQFINHKTIWLQLQSQYSKA